MKKSQTVKKGFTIAELLLSMLIVMLVASAMVPVIGPKKLKHFKEKYNHGVYECYWEEGTLFEYRADNKGGLINPQPSPSGSYCTFDIPKADKYEIIAIGAGSPGYNGTDIGYVVDNDNPTYRGDINLDSWRTSLSTNIHNIIGYNTVENIGDKNAFAAEVRNLMVEWNNAINAETGNSAPFRRLYAAFYDITAPVGSGGAGISWVENRPNMNTPFDGIEGHDTCQEIRDNNPSMYPTYGPITRPDGGFWSYSTYYDGTSAPGYLGISQGKCWYYSNASGSASAPAYRINDPNVPVLFTITNSIITSDVIDINLGSAGYRRDDGKDGELVGNEDMKIAVGNSNILLLPSSIPGYNAQANKNTPDTVDFDTPTLTGTVFYGNHNTTLNIDTHFSRSVQNPGSARGVDLGEGGLRYPDNNPNGGNGTVGSVSYSQPAFRWQFFANPAVSVRYGTSGEAGEVMNAVFPRLGEGQLFLYPGRSENNSPSAVYRRIFLDESDPAIQNPLPLLLAHSRVAEELTPHTETFEYSVNNGLPSEEIINNTRANNSKIDTAIRKLDSYAKYGINKGLYNCYSGLGACPGYGGSSIYPVLPGINTGQLLRLENLQMYARDLGGIFREYTRNYGGEAGKEINEIKCDNGSDPIVLSGDTYYCNSGSANRDGAIIILW